MIKDDDIDYFFSRGRGIEVTIFRGGGVLVFMRNLSCRK